MHRTAGAAKAAGSRKGDKVAHRSTIGTWTGEIAPDQIPDIDGLCLASARMPKKRLRGRSLESFERTREQALSTIICRAVFQGHPVQRIAGGTIALADGTEIACPALAEELAGAVEVVAFMVSAKGLEDLVSADGCSSVDAMFYNSWGVALASGGQRGLEAAVRERAHDGGLFTGKSWSPGYEGMPMSLQAPLFDLSQARGIGVELKESGLLKPVMSVGGFIGVFEDASVEQQKTVLMV